MERKNLINNLVKSMIDLAFPNIVKYLFWASEKNTGIFETLTEDDIIRFRRMSKYKKVELATNGKQDPEEEEEPQA